MAVKVTAEQQVQAGDLTLVCQQFGDADKPALVLVMGLGMQMISWPDDFCRQLADRGFRVIRFDNRDSGLSQKMSGQRAPGPLKLILASRLGLRLKVPYQLWDMAADTAALLDALDIEAAHLVGASMGGMIAQLVAAHYPQRVLSLTSIMSTSGNPRLPGPRREVLRTLMTPAAANEAAFLETAMRTWRLIGSPAFQPTDEELQVRLLRSYRRSYYPAGTARQLAAISASGSRVEDLKTIRVPALVIHGADDPLVPVQGGIDTAKHIPGARLEIIEGMGHDLPQPLLPRFAALIGEHAANAA